MPRACSAGWCATSISPAASRTARSSRRSPRPTCAAPTWWRAGSPACSADHAVARPRPPHHQADGHAGDAQADRQSDHAGGAGRHLSQGCRRAEARAHRFDRSSCYRRHRTMSTAHSLTDRYGVRRRLPVVLHRQAAAGEGDRAQARDSGRGALPPLFPQSLGAARRHQPRGISRPPNSARSSATTQHRQRVAAGRRRRRARPMRSTRSSASPTRSIATG